MWIGQGATHISASSFASEQPLFCGVCYFFINCAPRIIGQTQIITPIKHWEADVAIYVGTRANVHVSRNRHVMLNDMRQCARLRAPTRRPFLARFCVLGVYPSGFGFGTFEGHCRNYPRRKKSIAPIWMELATKSTAQTKSLAAIWISLGDEVSKTCSSRSELEKQRLPPPLTM